MLLYSDTLSNHHQSLIFFIVLLIIKPHGLSARVPSPSSKLPLLLAVKSTICLYTIVTFKVVRHTLRRVLPAIVRERRAVAQDMTQLSPRCVVLASTNAELVAKLTPKLVKPYIVIVRCASPNSAGVILVGDLVNLISILTLSHTMSRGHELSVLDDHFATMLVTMPLSTNSRVFCKEEDVHGLYNTRRVV
jgi:hypothetical protein